MSLSEDERKELELYRKREKDNNKFSWALTKGAILAFVFTGITPIFILNTVLLRRIQTFGILVCFAVGILSSYYGPFAYKKENPSLYRDKPKGDVVD